MDIVFAKDRNKKPNPFMGLWKKVVEKFKNFRFSNTFYYFLVLIVISIGFYMLMLVQNGFTLAYGGDYTAQYIPMGYHIWDYYHDWINTGHFTLFDPELYLGANSLGSNAYYGLFSPFNIIIVILPRVFVPHSVAITSMIKLACAGLFFSIYVKKAFKVKESVSFICGIAYAFCGWGAFYLWYNNYQDILVFLPIVLLGIEKTLQEEKPWVLALGVFFLAICNYVLMVPYLITTFFYAMFRFFQRIRTNDVKKNFRLLGLGFAGYAVGLLMAGFVFIPAFMATMSSPKLDSYSYFGELKKLLAAKDFKSFFELLFSWKKAPDQHGRIFSNRIWYPIIEFFFPPTTCRSLPTLELYNWDFDDIAVSLWCYIPFIMFLVPAFIQSGKEKKWSHYIALALILFSLFTPFMYYLTMGMTNAYARWTLIVPAILIAYVGTYLNKIPNVSRWHIHIGYAFALIGIIVSWILTEHIAVKEPKNGSDFMYRFVEGDFNFTTLAFILMIVYTTVVWIVLFLIYNKKAFFIVVTALVSAEAIAVGNFVTCGHGYDGTHNNGYAANERFRKVLTQVQKTDKSFYRVYTSIGDAWSINNSFINGYNSGSFFHSLYNFEIDDFTMWNGLRDGRKAVAGSYRGKYQDLDNLLGVKYYFISKAKSMYDNIEKYNPDGYLANVPHDFEEMKELETSEYKVYQNKNMNAFGHAYDTIYDGELVGDVARYDVTCVKNGITLANMAAVSKEDAEEIKSDSISVVSEKPEVPSVQSLYKSIDYRHAVYNVGTYAKSYDFAKIPDIDKDFEPVPNYLDEDTMKYFAMYTPMHDGEPLFKAGTSLYVRAPFSGSRKYNFYFIDKENKIFMMDAHDDDTSDNTAYMRGFYITRDVYKIAVCGKYFESYTSDSNIRFYSEDIYHYRIRWNKLNANPVTDIKYSADKFTFKTNYTSSKLVVSYVAFDNGWKIKAKDNTTGKTSNLKVYKANGGFVSFVAPVGDYSYEMTYQTPYLNISYLGSTFAFIGFFTSMLGYYLYHEKKKNHYLEKIYREN